MATIETRIAHNSGIPLGGLGTGSVEIRPDGHFHEWQIFNLGAWAPQQPEACRCPDSSVAPGALTFFVRTRQPTGPTRLRRLGMRTDQENLYSFTWLKSMQAITFTGRYPVATVDYHDADLPVTIRGSFFSPFVPHDAQTSGTPGFYAVFQLANRTRDKVEVSLAGALRNLVALGAEDRRLTNSVSRTGRTATLTMRTAAEGGCRPTHGSLSLSVTGGAPSWIAGEYSDGLPGYMIMHWEFPQLVYGMPHESWLYEFRRTGRLPSLPGNVSPSELLPADEAQLDALPDAVCRERYEQFLQYPFAAALLRRLAATGNAPREPAQIRAFLREVGFRLTKLAGRDRKRQSWGDGALAASLTLRPGETREVSFALAWHFPYHFSAKGPVLGHAYEHWFVDAEAVNRFLVARAAPLRRATTAFAETLYDTTLDPALADAWSAQLSTLAKCTWWTKDGNFAVWEGLGCCGFHTTDITYQGSFGILALFPELQKRQMEMGARFQREDGRVHHYFTPDFSAVDNGFDRVDMNSQFVLLVCRDYLWTADRAFLDRMWPHVLRAMDNTAQLDRDGDGLPDHDTRRNTYDGWNFFGTPSYIASLWLAALRAGVRLASEVGDGARASQWQARLEQGAQRFDAKLWNGAYYSLWVDGATRDECCMTDQLDGEWFTHLVGLGSSLPADRIAAALRAVLKHNYSAEGGLINASYPPGAPPRLSTYENFQATAPWTGIEYSMASMLMDFGLAAEGLEVVRNIHERHMRAGRFWNHNECGDHYYRAMSSWAVLLGATGFKVDAPRETVTFAPAFRRREVRAPWASSTGWGTFTIAGGTFRLTCKAGTLSLRRLRLALAGRRFKVTLGRRPIPAALSKDGALAGVHLARAIRVRPGADLVVARQ